MPAARTCGPAAVRWPGALDRPLARGSRRMGFPSPILAGLRRFEKFEEPVEVIEGAILDGDAACAFLAARLKRNSCPQGAR
jgi:hypothetical protein